jgi:hypothetical protein
MVLALMQNVLSLVRTGALRDSSFYELCVSALSGSLSALIGLGFNFSDLDFHPSLDSRTQL